ncbi:hypothetical protein FQA39_LY01718 [Lamprigera yunnana]|nr:hypothetical protein FQA39_LY01718 [Lamprigera yunnana]
MRILFLILLYISVFENTIIIKDAGIATVARGDIGLVFCINFKRTIINKLKYFVVDIQLENSGKLSYHLYVEMEKCCEVLSKSDIDCQMMQLVGGDMGIIKHSKIAILVYPNLYLHNRYGNCLIKIRYNEHELKMNIEFNTLIGPTQNPVLRGYYTKISSCKTVDLDPLELCAPVNCEMKYLGSRNFFNHYWNRCQKVPLCIADPQKQMPDVSYLPICNQCKDLDNIVTSADLKNLQNGNVQENWETQVAPMLSENIRCHHGVRNNNTGFCICHDGWMTSPVDRDQFEPSVSQYHMCNMRVFNWKERAHKFKIKATWTLVFILAAAFAFALGILAICCVVCYKCCGPEILSNRDDSSFYSDSLNCAISMDATAIDWFANSSASSDSYYNSHRKCYCPCHSARIRTVDVTEFYDKGIQRQPLQSDTDISTDTEYENYY